MKMTQNEKQRQLEQIMAAAPVIPVVVVDDPVDAVDLAQALVAGGLTAIEITLRTARALDCLSAVAARVKGAIAGAGTVLDGAQVQAVESAGAQFMVSPGQSEKLLVAAEKSSVPLLPGAATASEMMSLGEMGMRHLKFFPAIPAGGPSYLKALSAPLPQFRICPTGGVNQQNAPEFLALSNVVCVGGSWMMPRELVQRRDWKAIEKLARSAASLREE